MYKRNTLLFITVFILIAMVLLIFNACYKDYNLKVADYDAVITVRDEQNDYQGYATYFLDTDFINLGDPSDPSEPDNAAKFITEIGIEMANYGWTPVAQGTEDVTLRLGYSQNDYFYYYCDPYWGWYYPYYWCGYPTYAYSGGTVVIQMGDPNNVDGQGNILALWHAGINGILNDNPSSINKRIEDTVAQAYAQSPYLDRN